MGGHSKLRSRTKRRGATQIEFVLSIFIVIFVIFGIIEISTAVYALNVLGDAAREGVRYAIVHGSGNTNCSGGVSPSGCDPTGTNVSAVVQDYAKYSLHDTSSMTVNVSYVDGNNDPQSLVKVDVSYPYIAWIKLPWPTPTLRASAQGRIVH